MARGVRPRGRHISDAPEQRHHRKDNPDGDGFDREPDPHALTRSSPRGRGQHVVRRGISRIDEGRDRGTGHRRTSREHADRDRDGWKPHAALAHPWSHPACCSVPDQRSAPPHRPRYCASGVCDLPSFPWRSSNASIGPSSAARPAGDHRWSICGSPSRQIETRVWFSACFGRADTSSVGLSEAELRPRPR